MNCMRCGRAIALGQAFCKECLADMEKYPVKPGTPIQIPSQPTAPAGRRNTQSRKTRKPEEQLAKLRKTVFFQTLILVALVLAFGVSLFFFIGRIQELEKAPLPGQNYSTITTTTTSG